MSLTHWLLQGLKPVDPEQAERRAAVCVTCTKNEPDGLYEDVVGLAANVFKAVLRKKHAMKLQTPYDELLHTCDVCGCDLKLKAHTPPEALTMDEEFPAHCWVRKELSK